MFFFYVFSLKKWTKPEEWFNGKKWKNKREKTYKRHTSHFMSHSFCWFFDFVIVPYVGFFLTSLISKWIEFDCSYGILCVMRHNRSIDFFSSLFNSIQMLIGRRIDDCKCISPLLNFYACKFTHKIKRQTDRQTNQFKMNDWTNEQKGRKLWSMGLIINYLDCLLNKSVFFFVWVCWYRAGYYVMFCFVIQTQKQQKRSTERQNGGEREEKTTIHIESVCWWNEIRCDMKLCEWSFKFDQ